MQSTGTRLMLATLLASLSLVLSAVPAAAQQATAGPPRRTGWVFEIHLGSVPDTAPSKVLSQGLPPVGPGFTTVIGDPTRRVPSWYFGDGAALANGVVRLTGDPGRIVPLDPVLTSASVRRESGADFGFRIGHTITRRVLFEFSYDQVSGRLPLTSAASAAFAATNASFKPYWEPLITRPPTTNVSANSTLTIEGTDGNEKLISVAAEIRVITIHGWTSYVTVGFGIALPLPAIETRATLVGNYRFTFVNPGGANNGAQFNETDQVGVRYEVLPLGVGIVGAGVERHLTPHMGIRADVRSFLGANTIRTLLATEPISLPYTPVATIRRGPDPSLQVSTNPQLSSLSLQGVNHFESFKARGNLPTVSAGFFFRF